MKLVFDINTLDEEKKIVEYYLKNKDFFIKKRYYFTSPQKELKKEYQDMSYTKTKNLVEKIWLSDKTEFVQKIVNFFNIDPKQIMIKITGYGPSGFTDKELKTIYLNKNFLNKNTEIVARIKHELTHIFLEQYLQKFGYKHEQRENIVNQIVKILSM